MTKYWFRQKSFGYGATPNTWQGWTVTLISLGLILAIIFGAPHIADPWLRLWVKRLGIAAVLIFTIVICYVKTEGGWRWRNGDE